MKNEIYRRAIVPARLAEDGETATCIIVTEEANLFAVWRESFGMGTELLWAQYGASRESTLEWACRLVDRDTAEYPGSSDDR